MPPFYPSQPPTQEETTLFVWDLELVELGTKIKEADLRPPLSLNNFQSQRPLRISSGGGEEDQVLRSLQEERRMVLEQFGR
jgi:hypothetical protein